MKKLLLLPGGLVVLAMLALLMLPREPGAGRNIQALAAQQAGAKREGLHFQVVGEADLPPPGSRSLFDHLLRENGNLPYPFDRVIGMLAAYDAQGRLPPRLLIPDGRSLLKGQAHFARPRVVVAADAHPPQGETHAPQLAGRVFLGFVDDADEIEVISYNPQAGRFEFQLVENYCQGCVPRIVYARRAVCTTCHSGGAPIFPVRPWQETNVQPAIASRLVRQIEGEAYLGVPLSLPLDEAQRFDELTDRANVVPTTQRIWLDGCGADGANCRRALLKAALRYGVNPAAFDRPSEHKTQLLTLQGQHWPQAGIALADGDLNNRNPFNQALYDDSLWQQMVKLVRGDGDQPPRGDKLSDFDSLPRLPAEFDPLSPRAPKKIIHADDLDGVYALAQFFTSADRDRLDALSGGNIEALMTAVDVLDPALFGPAPFRRVDMLNALFRVLGGRPLAYCCADVAEMSQPVAQGEPPLDLAAGSVLEPFQSYCFACHRGNPAAKLNFMAGVSEDEVLDNIRATPAIREVLDFERYLGTRKEGTLMPPADAWQRQALNEAQARGENPLAAMRDQIPSLFEF